MLNIQELEKSTLNDIWFTKAIKIEIKPIWNKLKQKTFLSKPIGYRDLYTQKKINRLKCFYIKKEI